MSMKTMIHDLCFRFRPTRAIYLGAAQLKGRIQAERELGRAIRKHKRAHRAPVFLVFTPEHANLGDHAIAYAETTMLERLGLPYMEITGHQLGRLDQYGMLSMLDGALILFNGGGNLGTLWPDIERMNRQIILAAPRATIMILPNSIYYGDSAEDLQSFEASKRIYNDHLQLYLYARESISYERMKAAYNHVKLVPDMVLSLDRSSADLQRKGCILCLRSDTERTLSLKDHQRIKEIVTEMFRGNVIVSDTVLDHYVPVRGRERALDERFAQFSSAELVITDRLHGMIFCAITGTKCIVLDSKSPKLRGCYRWIEHLDYIRFAEDVGQINSIYHAMPRGRHSYTPMTEPMKELETDIMRAYSAMENRKVDV